MDLREHFIGMCVSKVCFDWLEGCITDDKEFVRKLVLNSEVLMEVVDKSVNLNDASEDDKCRYFIEVIVLEKEDEINSIKRRVKLKSVIYI